MMGYMSFTPAFFSSGNPLPALAVDVGDQVDSKLSGG